MLSLLMTAAIVAAPAFVPPTPAFAPPPRSQPSPTAPAAASATGGTASREGSVTVIAPKLKEVPQIVQRFAAPNVGERLARWKGGFCPLVAGLTREEDEAIRETLFKVASAAGVASPRRRCRGLEDVNAFVLVTPDSLKARRIIASRKNTLLSVGRWPADPDMAAAFAADDGRPAHAVYVTTDSGDLGGTAVAALEGGGAVEGGVDAAGAAALSALGFNAPVFRATPSRIIPGADRAIARVFLVIDAAQARGITVGQLGAFAAMATLAQVNLADPIAGVSSATRLFVDHAVGATPASEITFWDRSYLGALYGSSAQTTRGAQEHLIAEKIAHRIDALHLEDAPANPGVK